MNKLFVGFDIDVPVPRGGSLLIDREFRDVPDWRHPRRFDPFKDCFNPLADLDYRKACMIVDIYSALFPAGGTTLTKEAGLDYIGELLDKRPTSFAELLQMIGKPDKKNAGEVWAYTKTRRILRSPVLSKVFNGTVTFSMKKGSVNQARLNPKELVGFDLRALGWFLMAQAPGHIAIPSYRPYVHDMHSNFLEEERMTIGVPTLATLKGLQEFVPVMQRIPMRCSYDDAVEIAKYDSQHQPHTDGYDTDIKRWMA